IDLVERLDAMAIDGEMPSELQRSRLAGRPQIRILDLLEIGIVGEAKDAPVNLHPGKTQHVRPQFMDYMVQRLLGSKGIAAALEKACLIQDARAFRPPQPGKLVAEDFPGVGDHL